MKLTQDPAETLVDDQAGALNRLAQFVRHTLVYGLGSMLLQAVNIILLPLYTHYLPPAHFGVLDILNRTGDILVVLLMANGIRGAAFSFCCQAESDEQRNRNSSTVALATWVGCAAGIVISVGLTPFLGRAFGFPDQRLILLGLITSVSQMLPAVPMALMQARVESFAFVCSSVLTLLTRLAIVIISVAVLGWGIWGVLMGTLIANILSGTILSIREFSRLGFRPSLGSLPPVLRFAWPFVPGGVIGFALFSGDRYFLIQSAGAEYLGVYAVASRIATAVSTLSFAPLFKVWSASMYRVYPQADGPMVLGVMFTRLVAPSMFVGLAVFVFRSEILFLLSSPRYWEAAMLIGPLTIGSWLITAQILGDGPFYVYRRSRTKLLVTIASTIVAVSLYAILIPRFNAWGAALAVMLSSGAYAAITICTAQRVFRIEFEWLRLFAAFSLTVLLGMAGLFAVEGPFGVVSKVGLVAAWPLILWFANVISSDEKAVFISIMARCASVLGRKRHQYGRVKTSSPAITAAPVQSKANLPDQDASG